MKFWNYLKETIHTWLALDYRSLALLRIGIGLTILFDLIQRSTSLFAHYTDGGVLPRSELLRLWNMDWTLSIHLMSGELWVQIVLFSIAGIFALFLIFGYRTRLSIIISWFLLISLQSRNPLVLQGGDVVFRTTVFFMMFLPLARVWSLDRLFNRVPQPTEKTVADFSTFAYIVQVCLLYILTGVLKTGTAWHADGTAVYYALNVDQLVTPFGVWLRNIPAVLPFFTHAVWLFETFGTILFFIPWKNWIFRFLGVVGFIALQTGFNLSMRLGLFGMITISTLFGLIPSEFWDTIFSPFIHKLRNRGKTGLTIIYDFDCTFCHKVSFLIARLLLLHPATKIISSTENETGRLVMEQENSWVIIDSAGAIYTGFRGMASVVAHSPYGKFIAPIMGVWPIQTIGETLYRFVANRRTLVCNPEPTVKPLPRWQETILGWTLLFSTFFVTAWNIETLGHSIIPQQLRPFALITRLDQEFNMFAPTPLVEDGWYIMPGKLRNGTQVDVFSGVSPVSYEKPNWVAYTYKDQRWQKYLMNLWSSSLSEFRLGYGRYLCRTWNSKHLNTNEELLSFDIIFMLEMTPPPGGHQKPVEPQTIWHHECF